MKRHRIRMFGLLIGVTVTLPALSEKHDLIVVDDLGGVSALPYYRDLNLKSGNTPRSIAGPGSDSPPPTSTRYSEANMLPVRSARLTPGAVEPRTISVPGLRPLFLIGDDEHSRTWLRKRLPRLLALRAVGFVVNVSSAAALASLRELAPGLTLAPVSGDDIGARLELHHYPVLITATGIEQ